MSEPIISLQNLTQSFDGTTVVDGLTFDIARGEVFGFLGHNGAGKTTTVHMLTTLAPPAAGTALVAGHDIRSAPLEVRRSIGYVPENVRLYETLTARENLMFFARLSGLEAPARAVDETLEIVAATDLADRRVETFSKGMRQRIGLAQAILHRPLVLFLDEPSSGLDPMGMRMLRDLVSRLNAAFGMTIFMNSHLLGEVAKSCTSIGILGHGRLTFHDTIGVVTERYGDDAALEELYLSLSPMGRLAGAG